MRTVHGCWKALANFHIAPHDIRRPGSHFVTEQPADIRDVDAHWNRACPHCGAKVQPVARACWQCGAQISDPDSEHADYRPPAIDADEVSGMSISVLLSIAFFLSVAFVLWVLSFFW